MPARVAAATGQVLSTDAPANNAKLTNEGARSSGGLENLGTQTSNEFTATEDIKCIETVSVPLVSPPGTPPSSPVPGLVNDGTESCATPYISVTGISIPSSWTVPATGKSESLSGAPSAPNNTGTGTYTIFPDVKITISSGASTGGAGVAGSTKQTVAQIIGPVMELDNWVVPWTPTDKPPNFDGSDFGLARSAGYGNTAKGGPGIFYVTVELTYGLIFDVGGTSTTNKTALNFKVGVINNYSNDRETYMAAYEKAHASLTKVPELSEWQT